jgi:predicted hotdog family 3-hydroxylacyl-ACP dehydratase
MNIPPIAELVPHAAPMLLLDRVVEAGTDRLVSEVTIRADALFCDGERVGAWVGIEYMAQTIAAMAGWRARLNGWPVRIGFLLGTRKYISHVSAFSVGDCLRIEAVREVEADTGIGAVHCRIVSRENHLLAEAMLTVFQPDNLQEFLQAS